MTKLWTVAALVFGVTLAADAFAQEGQPGTPSLEDARLKMQIERLLADAERARREAELRADTIIPVEIEVVISRFQGDKRVSSLPYVLTVNAVYGDVRSQNRMSLRMGGAIPIPVMASPVEADGKPTGALVGAGPVQYRDVGTQIDCAASPLGDGRFELFISVEDAAVAPTSSASAAPAGAPPVIRTFQTSNTITLRDGQTRQFTAASDRITGEVVRVDVTLRVVK